MIDLLTDKTLKIDEKYEMALSLKWKIFKAQNKKEEQNTNRVPCSSMLFVFNLCVLRALCAQWNYGNNLP